MLFVPLCNKVYNANTHTHTVESEERVVKGSIACINRGNLVKNLRNQLQRFVSQVSGSFPNNHKFTRSIANNNDNNNHHFIEVCTTI